MRSWSAVSTVQRQPRLLQLQTGAKGLHPEVISSLTIPRTGFPSWFRTIPAAGVFLGVVPADEVALDEHLFVEGR